MINFEENQVQMAPTRSFLASSINQRTFHQEGIARNRANKIHKLIREDPCSTSKVLRLLFSNQPICSLALRKSGTLHLACEKGLTDVVKALLKFKGLIYSRFLLGFNTPLHIASENGHYDIVQLLLGKLRNSDVNIKNKNDELPIHLASRSGHAKVVKLLIQHGAHVNTRDNNFSSPLQIASRVGSLFIVQDLLKNGADPNSKNMVSNTPLMDAAFNDHLDVVKELLNFGADISLRNSQKRTAMYYAIFNLNTSIVKMLLEFGANPDEAIDSNGTTALHIISRIPYCPSIENYHKHKQIVSDFLLNGCNLNIQDFNGNTPLHIYVMYHRNHVEISILENILVKHQEIDFQIRNIDGYTSLDLAIKYCNNDVVRLLSIKGCPEPNISHSMYPLKYVL